MKTITWNRTGWIDRSFIFSMGHEIIGQLTFNSTWNFNGVYADKETELEFAQKSFWDRDVLITKDGKTVGEIHSGHLGEQTLKLVTGERFIIFTSFWEQEAYWRTEKGEVIMMYQQAIMSSLQKGVISLKGSLTVETEKLLISSGLFARQSARRRIARTAAAMIPIMAAASGL